MKKVYACGLAVIILLVMCLVGCVSADPDAAIRGRLIGRTYFLYDWRVEKAWVDCYDTNMNDYGQLTIYYSADTGLYSIALKYSGVIKKGAYAIIRGKEYHTLEPYPKTIGLCGIDDLTKEEVLAVLEDKLSLTCYFRCDEDPAQNVYFTITSENANALRKWVKEHD